MELYEYVVKRLIGVLAAHLLDIVSEGRTDELPGLSAIADGIMGTEADNIRKANLENNKHELGLNYSDNDLFNSGIVDFSHRYPKMYVDF